MLHSEEYGFYVKPVVKGDYTHVDISTTQDFKQVTTIILDGDDASQLPFSIVDTMRSQNTDLKGKADFLIEVAY